MATSKKSSSEKKTGARGAGKRTIAKTVRRLIQGSGAEDEVRMNRTGLGNDPDLAREAIEGADGEAGGRKLGAARELRRTYLAEGEPIGSVPAPVSIAEVVEGTLPAAQMQGARSSVLIDRLADRMAFERGGTRLYDALLGKLEVFGSFDGGPSRHDLQHIRDEERAHFIMLKGCIESLGADPTAVTPSANLSSVECLGILQVIADPRTTLGQGLHAILVAEAADVAGWDLLIELAEDLGQEALLEGFREAEVREGEHLLKVKEWLGAFASIEVPASDA